MKKVLIVEVNFIALCAMFRLARDAGYEVRGVLVANNRESDANVTCTDDPEQIIEAVRFFKPDIVLMEQDLGLGSHITGRYLVRRLELRRETLIGTSIYDQPYCGHVMRDKTRLDSHPLPANKFRNLLLELASKEEVTQPVA